MSESHNKLPKIFWMQLALAAVIGIVFLVTLMKQSTIEATGEAVKSIASNLAPIGKVVTKDLKATASTKVRSGEEVYKASCQACHATGVANAPKIDDKAAWDARVEIGLDGLTKTAINGKGAMPARGGNPAITDEEIKTTVLYMTGQAGFELDSTNVASTKAEESVVVQPAVIKKAEVKTIPKVTSEIPPAVSEKAVVVANTKIIEPTAPIQPKTPTSPNEIEKPAIEKFSVEMGIKAKQMTEPAEEEIVANNNAEGKKVYKSSCFACHDMGVAGSPKIGDKPAWVTRIATGKDLLYKAAISGKGVMPAKGGNTSLSDGAVQAAVDYMIAQSK